MEDVVPLLAEAAPDPFLRALAKSANGTSLPAVLLFQDVGDQHWNAGSPHTGFLWALEGLAWSEQYLGYAAEVLAQLAELDPGGRLSNRPAASLEAIFRPWAGGLPFFRSWHTCRWSRDKMPYAPSEPLIRKISVERKR
jgi:hypothetical protein